MDKLTIERLREVLTYDPSTGVWTRNSTGKPAGSIDKAVSYIRIGIDGGKYWAHRLAWFWMTDEWPPAWPLRVDHEDTDGLNNRWANLRIADASTNHANRGAPQNNTSGIKGVSFCKSTGRWRADICVRGKSINLGRAETKEEAGKRYEAAAIEHFGEFARAS